MIAKTIRTCFPIAAAAVSDKAEEINKLNVFPVPDGDTGTNMSLTLASVTKELSALPADADMEAIAGAITHGSLMGARGNSGVITSQILRGVAEGLVSADEPITSANIAFAFRRAVKVAFQAVRKPIEGTILTVLRDVSTKADECEKKKFSAEDALDAIVVEAYQSVARTPDLLPVLKENGVVDSGAFGFAIFLENFVAAALGRSTVVEDFSATFDSAGSARDAALGRVEIEANDDWEGSEFRYCNEFLFKADAPFDEDECLKFLGSMGDCELLVGGGASTNTGNGYELEAIAACTIGGVSTNGGVGKVSGVLVGVLVFEVLKICLQFLGVDPAYTYIAQGLVIVIAVALDLRKYLGKK